MTKVRTNFKEEKPRYFFREWRKHRGLTQEALADRVGLTASSISQLEKGKQGFTDSTLAMLADALSCSPGDLLMRNPLQTNSIWSIQEQLQKASPEQQKQITDFVDYVLRSGTGG